MNSERNQKLGQPALHAFVIRAEHRVGYVPWIQQAHIEASPGEVVDYERIRAQINELGKRFKIEQIAIDRWNAT